MALCRVFGFQILQCRLKLCLPKIHHLTSRCLHVTNKLATDCKDSHSGGQSGDKSSCKRPIRQKKTQSESRKSSSGPLQAQSQEKQPTCQPIEVQQEKKKESELPCTRELMSPRCKVVIITGGTNGIGFSTACHFLRNCARHVIITGPDQEEGESAIKQLEERYGDNTATFVCGDVANENHFESLFEMACDAYGGADILFNNAGIFDDNKWCTEVDVNIKGTIRGTLLAFKYMGLDRGGKGGLVINNAAVAGLDPLPQAPIYSTTKYAIVGLTRNFGDPFYMCNTGVRVVGICPSSTKTDMIEDTEGKYLCPSWCEEGHEAFNCPPVQSPSAVGQGVIYITKYGPNGSQWVMQDSSLYQLELPCRHNICEFAKEFRCGATCYSLVSSHHVASPFRNLHIPGILQSERPVRQKPSGLAEIPKELMCPEDKVAIVTGGTNGIGYSVTCHLLAEGAKHVFINGIDPKDGETAVEQLEERYCDERVTFVCGDVRDAEHFEGLFKQACECHGGVDILFNNAGIADDRSWEKEQDINIKGTILGTLLAFKYMGKDMGGKGGVVVNNSSIFGLQACPGSPMYSTSKHAILGTVLNFGHQFHNQRNCVRVCGLCPGVTETDILQDTANIKYTPEWGEEAKKQLSELPKQSPDVVGQAFLYLIKYAPSGTIWVIEDSKLLYMNIPSGKCIIGNKPVATFKC